MVSPCIKKCELQNGVCVGCNRTIEQITNWSHYTEHEQLNIINTMTQNKLELTGKNFELTDAIKSAVEEKMNKVFDHDETARINVVLEEMTSHSPDEFRAAGNLTIHSKTYHAEAKTGDMYKSINELSQLLLRDVRKEHRKFEDERKSK